MTTVYLVRHAEAEGNLYRRAHGCYDSTITENGYRQIAALAKRFEKEHIDAVYSSDLLRARTTALAFTRVHGLPLRTMEKLREVNLGPWEDRTWAWLAQFDRARLVTFNTDARRWRVKGAQRMSNTRNHMMKAVRDIVKAHPDQTVAVVSHGMALRLLIGTLEDLTFTEINRTGHGENTAVTKLEADENGIRVVYRDDASHLPEELRTLNRQTWTKNKGGLEPGIWFAPDPEEEGRFEAFHDGAAGESVGAVAVKKQGPDNAELVEIWLDEDMQGKGYGIRLVGQAVSYARSLGCDKLRVVVQRQQRYGMFDLRHARQYGFDLLQKVKGNYVCELYFGQNADYSIAKLGRAWQELYAPKR